MEKAIGVLWDLDGVIVDTGEFHFQSWSRAFAGLDVHFPFETFQKTFGLNNDSLLELVFGDRLAPKDLQDISARKEMMFRESIHGLAVPLPGVMEWLERLLEWGVSQAVASSAPQANIDALVDELNIRRYFQALVTGTGYPGKPDPGVFLKAAQAIQVVPERCVVIEDAIAGVEAARRAGMKCVAVLTTNPAHRLQQADVIVDRLDALSPLIMRELLGLPR